MNRIKEESRKRTTNTMADPEVNSKRCKIDNDYKDDCESHDNDYNSDGSDCLQNNLDEKCLQNETSKNNITTDDVAEELNEESKIIQQNPWLREFVILDEIEEGGCDDEDDAHHSSSKDENPDTSEELPVEDIDAMLEEGLYNEQTSGKAIKLKCKVTLEEKGYDHFQILPEGWIKISHSSGMPVYLHKESRVCTMSKPYFLGNGSLRNHKTPLSAIPCLQYKRALETEDKIKQENKKKNKENENKLGFQLATAKIETSDENECDQSLEAVNLREYCEKLFNFKTNKMKQFTSWADRRKYDRMIKEFKNRQVPTLPADTKLLKFPIKNADGSVSNREWIINPNGKSYVCILNDYVQNALKQHPKYEFKELENQVTPYSATVFIGEMRYGVGLGARKKQAKVEAAKAALEVLIPGIIEKIERDSQSGMQSDFIKRSQVSDLSIFDQIKVEDPRVAEFCTKTSEPLPYALLLNCLSSNMGLGKVEVLYGMTLNQCCYGEFTMKVGNHKVTVQCKSKRDGKQRAAQAILKALHPNITHWGSLLRMYGNMSVNVKEKMRVEQQITRLQSKASLDQPNFAVLEKLRTEMLKLRDKRDAAKAKGVFIPPENVILPSLLSADLNKVNLS